MSKGVQPVISSMEQEDKVVAMINTKKPVHEHENMNLHDTKQEKVLYFQDFFSPSDSGKSKMDTAEIFFELANAPIVGYKLSSIKCSSSKKRKLENRDSCDTTTAAILVQQDNSCQSHTGGIVWETSYLLANYLCAKYLQGEATDKSNNTSRRKRGPLGKTLEVGSGCGMLGLILSASGLCKKVVMTETEEVIPNLLKNVEYNKHDKNSCAAQLKLFSSKTISVRQLRWDAFNEDIRHCQSELKIDDLDPHTFDTIVGTDVIFSTSLVKPLLKTLRKMSHDETNIYLVVQVRCEDSHALFLKKASKYDFNCLDCSEKLSEFPSCSFGLELDCRLLHLTVCNKNIEHLLNI